MQCRISGKKIITGREFKPGDEFTFTVTSPDGGKLPEPASETIYPTEGYEASFTFSDIEYTLEDAGKTFTYIVTESGHGDGVTNDTNDHKVKITVTDNLDGTLTAKPTYDDGDHLTFTNVYKAASTKATIEGKKIITGREFKEGDEFTFTVTSPNGGKLPNPAEKTIHPVSGYEASFTFNEIEYTSADAGQTYTYEINESGSGDGVTNDSNTHIVKIKVTDNLDGTLSADVAYDDGKHLEFNNTYTATPTKAKIEGKKIITGREFQEGDNFTFTVTSTDGGKLPDPVAVTVTPTKGYETSFEFAEIEFTAKDVGKTYTYHVTESGDGKGVTNDSKIHVVKIKVTDNLDGTLTAKPSYDDGEHLTFKNVYKAEATATLEGKKLLTGREFKPGDEFTFTVTSPDGGNLPSPDSVTIYPTEGYEASFTFEGIVFDENDVGKTYTYHVLESGKGDGVTNDQHTHVVKFTILDPDKDGELVAAPNYDDGDHLSFHNTYSVDVFISKTDITGEQ